MISKPATFVIGVFRRALSVWFTFERFSRADLYWFIAVNTLLIDLFMGLVAIPYAYVTGAPIWLHWLAGCIIATPITVVLMYLGGNGLRVNLDLRKELEKAQADLEIQANQDFLTGLANRRAFAPIYERAWNSIETEGGFVLLTVDLDGFKTINDQHGHDAGDAVLVETAMRLERILKPFASIIVRLGGDEFAALIKLDLLTRNDDAMRLGRKVCVALQQPVAYRGHMLDIAASVGIASTNSTFPHRSALAMAADAALLDAKVAGKGCVRIYQADGTDSFQTTRYTKAG